MAKTKQTKVRISDDSITINLQAPVFHGQEEEWPEFIGKFQAFLVINGYAEVIQTNFKSKLPTTDDEELDASTKLGKAKKLGKLKNMMALVYVTQCLSGMSMSNAIFKIQAEEHISCLIT